MTCANDAAPLLLPWKNNTISSDGRLTSRGIGIGIGNPPQLISLWPWTYEAYMWLYNDTVCGDDAKCLTQRGGVYDAAASTTFAETSEANWNGSMRPLEIDNYTWFNDVVHFSDSRSASGSPLVLAPSYWASQAGVGIGWNSTFLDAAVSSNSAPTRNWGLYAGSRSTEQPADGALVLGGYDSNRVDGDFQTFRGTNKCDTCTIVKNMTYVTSTTSTSLILSEDQTFWVQIAPMYKTIELPAVNFENLLQAFNGTADVNATSSSIQQILVPSDADLGYLNITLTGGYQSIIPAHELFLPPRSINNEGIYEITNDTYYVSVLGNRTSNDTGSYALGLPFLAMNYLTMDFDWDTFSLAPVRQGDFSPNLKPLCQFNGKDSSRPNGSETDNDTMQSAAPKAASKANAGSIAGAVIGGLVAAALVAFLIWFFVRREDKKRKQSSRQEKYQAVTSYTENFPKQQYYHQENLHYRKPESNWVPAALSHPRDSYVSDEHRRHLL